MYDYMIFIAMINVASSLFKKSASLQQIFRDWYKNIVRYQENDLKCGRCTPSQLLVSWEGA